jgi:hypothetical protein
VGRERERDGGGGDRKGEGYRSGKGRRGGRYREIMGRKGKRDNERGKEWNERVLSRRHVIEGSRK